MDSKAVSKEIRAKIWPLLRAAGFSRFTTRTAWRYSNNKIDVVNFQSFNAYHAEIMGVTTFSFSVNLGSFLTYVPPTWPLKLEDGHVMPSEAQCQFRQRLKRNIAQPDINDAGLWSVDKQGWNLVGCVQDVAEQVPGALAWFARLADKSEVLSILLNQEQDMTGLWGFGRRPSPIRSYLTGYSALAVGNQELARVKLREAVQSNCFTKVFADVDDAIKLVMGTA
jgi:hypothetical protein